MLLQLFLVTISLPTITFIYLVMLLTTGYPVFFTQQRIGKNGKIFKLYKFRTMVIDAEDQKKKILKLNEADGPVFKIYDDPRFTRFGKILSRTGLDELPQFLNILKGDMKLVGPRPLPIEEANKIPKKYRIREKVLPGIISPWVVSGMHELKFNEWMELDAKYVKNSNLRTDLVVIAKSTKLIIRNIYLVLKDLIK